MTDLAYLTATDALSLFRARELSPVELMRAVLARAEETEPTVNALCDERFEAAIARAIAAERRYHEQAAIRPLEGLPLAIKEEEPIAGRPLTFGSLIFQDEVATHTSAFARRMLDSGAIVHARTTTPEFSCMPFTRSKLWGTTRNPWNPEFGAGGSSGGAGAALAAGSTTLASGSDMAGSIRIPASLNGVVGYRPPYGRIPAEPPFNLDTYLQNGPMARTVADARLFQNAIVGPDRSDMATLPAVRIPDTLEEVRGMRIAVSVDLGGWAVDPEVATNTLLVAETLRHAGAVVEVVDLALSREVVRRASALRFKDTMGFFEDLIARHPGETSDYITTLVQRHADNAAVTGTRVDMYTLENEVYAAVAAVFDDFDALICPTAATRGLPADEEYTGGAVLGVGDASFADPMDGFMTLPFNILSRCPVLAVPSGFADNGLPTGIQIVGPPYQDAVVFRVGLALEQAQPWFTTPQRTPTASSAVGR